MDICTKRVCAVHFLATSLLTVSNSTIVANWEVFYLKLGPQFYAFVLLPFVICLSPILHCSVLHPSLSRGMRIVKRGNCRVERNTNALGSGLIRARRILAVLFISFIQIQHENPNHHFRTFTGCKDGRPERVSPSHSDFLWRQACASRPNFRGQRRKWSTQEVSLSWVSSLISSSLCSGSKTGRTIRKPPHCYFSSRRILPRL